MTFRVLSRKAGEEGAPAQPGEVRGRKSRRLTPPHLPVAYRNGALLLPLKEREKTLFILQSAAPPGMSPSAGVPSAADPGALPPSPHRA